MGTRKGLAVVAAVLGLAFTAQVAGADAEEMIKYRQAAMKSLGGHMGAMAQIVRGKVPFSAHMGGHAAAVAAVSREITPLFPEGSDFGETDALPEIWKKRAEFEKAAAGASKAADALVAAVKGGDKAAIGTAFDDVGKACKGCHDEFRKKD
jgi:cytochrome c556